MGKTLLPAAILILSAGCDDSVTSLDDAGVCDTDGGCERALDASPPPGRTFIPDAAPPDGPPPVISCDAAPRTDPPPGLSGLVAQVRLAAGGPPGAGRLLATNVDGDADETIELVVVRGGRVEAYASGGANWWRTDVLAATELAGVADLDGDGRREVVGYSDRDAFVLDGLTGRVLWRLPEALFGPGTPTLALVTRVLLADVTGDGLPELYVADGGCAQGGQGYGAVVTFAGGVEAAVVLPPVLGPRRNGRCARWHSFADVDGDGAPEVLVTDGQGINGFDARTGARKYCGELPDAPPDGRLPHVVTDDGLLVFDRTRVMWVELRDGTTALCDTGPVLAERWVTDLGGPVAPGGSGVAHIDDDGVADVVTSYWDGAAWRTVMLSGADGGLVDEIADARLLGVLPARAGGEPRLLLRRGDGELPTTFGRIELREGADTLWTRDEVDAVTPTPTAAATRRTRELTEPVVVGEAIVLVAATAGRASRLLLVDPTGDERARALGGRVGVVTGVPDGLVVGLADGTIAHLDGELRLLNGARDDVPAARAPSGAPTFAVATDGDGPLVVALTAPGVLVAFDTLRGGAERWRVDVGGSRRAGAPPLVQAREGRSSVVVVRDARIGPTTWAGLDAETGAVVWRHTGVEGVDTPKDPILAGGLVIRFDVGRPDERPPPDPRCPADVTNADDLAGPDPECPDLPVLVRVVTAIDAATGECRWRSLVRSNTACGGPGNQGASVADGVLYVTESDSVRRFDLETGEIVATGVAGVHDTGFRRGGGWIRATGGDPPLLRAGGNGPLEALDADLTLAWRAPGPEQRAQAWIQRDAVALGDGVWTAPAVGLPLHRYALADGALTGTLPLLDGARTDDDAVTADVRWIQRVEDDGSPVLLVGADDAWIYAVRTDGALPWTRAFAAAVGQTSVVDADADGVDELVVALADGEIVVHDRAGIAAPPAVWDLPCPPQARCEPADDIDETGQTDALCAELVPVDGADGYEARVVAEFDAVVRDWVDHGPATTLRVSGLRLVPGLTYRVQVRAWRAVEGRLERSAVTSTDGVRVVNDSAPEVEVTVTGGPVEPGGEPLVVRVDARDDDLLAGWVLEVTDLDDARVRGLANGALAHASFAARREWDGLDDTGRALPAGTYRVRARFTDRARNEGTAAVEVAVCAAPCQ